jgi:hypothetical protein
MTVNRGMYDHAQCWILPRALHCLLWQLPASRDAGLYNCGALYNTAHATRDRGRHVPATSPYLLRLDQFPALLHCLLCRMIGWWLVETVHLLGGFDRVWHCGRLVSAASRRLHRRRRTTISPM